MKHVIYIIFAAVILSLVPATYACAQTGSAGKIETPKERKARLEREAAEKKRREQEAAAKRKREQAAREQAAREKAEREQAARDQAECVARLRSCKGFSESLARYKDANGKWGFIDKDGKVAISCQWRNAGDFHEGLAWVLDANGTGYIDKMGEIVIPCIWREACGFHEGLAQVMDTKFKWHTIDKTGKIVK